MNNKERWVEDVRKTRAYGSCYIPLSNRKGLICKDDDVVFSWKPFGRSFLGGGNKCKAYAHRISTGKAVPTKELLFIF